MTRKIIASESFPADRGTSAFSVILTDRGPDEWHRYVTHCRNDELGGCYWGHYFNNEHEARADFHARAAKYRR